MATKFDEFKAGRAQSRLANLQPQRCDPAPQQYRQERPRTEQELRDYLEWTGREALYYFPGVQAALLDAVDDLIRLRAALVEMYAARLYYGDKSPGWVIWEFLALEERANYRQQARDRINEDVVAFLAREAMS